MNLTGEQFQEAFDAYVECALWSSTDNSDESGGEPLDKNYGAEDVAAETLEDMSTDLADFVAGINHRDGTAYLALQGPEQLGHDFWLTRNGHGAGFWDRGLGDLGERLSEEAKVYGSYDLYLGDDNKIHGM